MDRRWVVAGAVAAVAATAAVALAVVGSSPRPEPPKAPRDGIAVPPRGGVAAAFGGDGRPVWVVHHSDGRISVLDALSSHVPFGIHKTTWWCPDTHIVEDPFHGSLYDEFGARIAGPAPSGLGRFAYEVREGRLVVDDAPPRAAGQGDPPPGLVGCTADEALTHEFSSLPEATSPADAAAHADGWLRLRATLVPVPAEDAGHVCARADGEDCVEVALPGMERFAADPPEVTAPLVESWTDANWLVHVVDGAIVEISRLPEPSG